MQERVSDWQSTMVVYMLLQVKVQMRLLARGMTQWPIEGIWSPIPNMDHGKDSAAAASIGSRIAVAGLESDPEYPDDHLTSLELFNVISGRWEVTKGTPFCSYYVGFAMAELGG